MNPLNVLLVTYSFPPAGGVGVLRAASLARYLPSEGIRLDVITARNPSAVGRDSTLLSEIPGEVTVHHTVTLDIPFGIKKWIKKLITLGVMSQRKVAADVPVGKTSFLKRVVQDILLPDPQVMWLPVLARAVHRIVKERNIHLVLITVPPFSSVLLVKKLRKQFPDLRIVVDFRDEWLSTTINLVSFSSSERAMKVSRDAEASAVKDANAIVAVTEAARREIRCRYPLEPESKFRLVPNGFDAARLHSAGSSATPHSRQRIVVSYVGSIYRSTEPTMLVQALQSLPPAVKSRFKLRFIGHIEEPRFREALLQLNDMVELTGYMPQHEALATMNDTDYALLLTHDRLNISAKFYDYIGSGKPILGCVHPEGDVRRLLETLRAGWWADSRDVEGIRQLFLDAASRGSSLTREFHPDIENIARYERRFLAHNYAVLLHSIPGTQLERDQRAPDAKLAGILK